LPTVSILASLCLCSLIGRGVARAAEVETAYPFAKVAMPELLLGVGTRITALGGAGAALSNGLASLYWNPAGLSQVSRLEAAFDHHSWIQDVSQECVSIGMPLLGGTAAIGLNYIGLGEIEQTGIAADGQPVQDGGTLGLSMFGATVGYGMATPGGIAFGGALKYMREALGESSLMTAAADAGLQFPLAETGVTVGAALQNLGLPVGGYALPLGVRVGAAYGAQVFSDHQIQAGLETEWLLSSGGQSLYHFGIEYAFGRRLFVRAGYTLSEVFARGTGGGLTAGLGAWLGGWKLGYTYAPQGDLGLSHRITLGLDLEEIYKPAPAKPRSLRPQSQARPQMSFAGNMNRSFTGTAKGAEVPALPTKKRAAPALSADERVMQSLIQKSLCVQPEAKRGIIGVGAVEAIVFRVTRPFGPKIKSWTLAVSKGSAQAACLRGSELPEAIRWDLTDPKGRSETALRGLVYKLILTDVNGDQESAAGPVWQESAACAEPDSAREPAAERTFTNILFDQGRAEVTTEASREIAEAAKFMRKYPQAKILIEGFCDPVGEAAAALILSKTRAEAVARYLTAYHKISITRILIRPRGVKNPGVRSGEPARRRLNRRVKITVKP